MTVRIEFELNGRDVSATAPPDAPLRDVLREEFGRTDVKSGCLSGRCGVCTVRVDGQAVKSCLTMAAKADGSDVTTVAGVADGDELHPLQDAFVEHFAVQCGYCTPGFIMSALDYVEADPSGDRDDIKAALKGNLCRCTGYVKILDAMEAAVEDVEPGD